MRIIACFVVIVATFWGFSQNIDLIKKANLFDENRGYVEENAEEVDTEKEIKLPSKMPVLDGIVIIKGYKRAIFTYYDNKKKRKVSAYHSPGDKFAGASLKEITPEYVLLVYDGKKYKLYPDTKLKAKKTGSHSSRPVMGGYTPPPPKPSTNSAKTVSRSSSKAKSGRSFKRPVTSRSKSSRSVRSTRSINKSRNVKKRPVSSKGGSNPFAGGRVKTPPTKKNKNKRINTPF